MSNDLGRINTRLHHHMAKETQAKADAIRPSTRDQVETKERLEQVAQQHRNIVKTGDPHG